MCHLVTPCKVYLLALINIDKKWGIIIAQFFSLEIEAFLYCQNTHTIAAIICFIDDLNLILNVTVEFTTVFPQIVSLQTITFLEVRMQQVFKRENYSREETIVF